MQAIEAETLWRRARAWCKRKGVVLVNGAPQGWVPPF